MKRRRFVLLDRDGTIIVERHHLSDPEQVELLPGAASGLRRLRQLGLGLVVITNQSAVGRGLIDAAQLDRIHQRMFELLKVEQVTLDGLYSCPHLPEAGCRCRKPETALIEIASLELGFEARESFVIGDQASDIEMGKKAGAKTFLVLTGYGEKTRDQRTMTPDFVAADLGTASEMIGQLLGAK